MSTSAICGDSGAVIFGTHTVLEINKWTLNIKGKTIHDVSKFADSAKEKIICGAYDWTGSFSGFENAANDANGQAAAFTALTGGTTVTLHLSENGTIEYTGTAYITQQDIDTAYNSPITVAFNFEGSGTLTQTLA